MLPLCGQAQLPACVSHPFEWIYRGIKGIRTKQLIRLRVIKQGPHDCCYLESKLARVGLAQFELFLFAMYLGTLSRCQCLQACGFPTCQLCNTGCCGLHNQRLTRGSSKCTHVGDLGKW